MNMFYIHVALIFHEQLIAFECSITCSTVRDKTTSGLPAAILLYQAHTVRVLKCNTLDNC